MREMWSGKSLKKEFLRRMTVFSGLFSSKCVIFSTSDHLKFPSTAKPFPLSVSRWQKSGTLISWKSFLNNHKEETFVSKKVLWTDPFLYFFETKKNMVPLKNQSAVSQHTWRKKQWKTIHWHKCSLSSASRLKKDWANGVARDALVTLYGITISRIRISFFKITENCRCDQLFWKRRRRPCSTGKRLGLKGLSGGAKEACVTTPPSRAWHKRLFDLTASIKGMTQQGLALWHRQPSAGCFLEKMVLHWNIRGSSRPDENVERKLKGTNIV